MNHATEDQEQIISYAKIRVIKIAEGFTASKTIK